MQNVTENQCNIISRNGQLVFSLNSDVLLPEDAPVRIASAQLEELEYGKLYAAYSSKGRKSAVDPRVLFKVMVYGYECGIFSSRKLEEACRYRVDFMWLLEEQKAPDHTTFARFRTGRCKDAVGDLFYQYVKLLDEQGETDHEAVFIDGTKIESRAGRYTFCWKKSTEKQLERTRQKSGCRTLTELRTMLAEKSRNINFVYGSGHRKSQEQRDWETLDELRQKWEQYEQSLAIMGSSRNSYAKTDHDATFMRMKEDHMRNGQLKPAYNVQIGVNSEYITGVAAYSDRSDSKTLQPFLQNMERNQQSRYAKVVADAGYESKGNYLYLESTGQLSFIKPANYEKKRTKKFKAQIGRVENMQYAEEEDCYICAEERRLPLRRENTELQNGIPVTTAWYRCEDCGNCPQRSACCRKSDAEAPKELRLERTFWEHRAVSEENISTEEGIKLRINRSIQVEGTFGLLKTDFGFKRFLTVGNTNIQTELYFLALGFNLKKYWMKQQKARQKTHFSGTGAA